ncbi:MAG: MFS transporter [Pseudomonadota bacterium]
MTDAAVPPRPGKLRLILFASGDFAFNLYWQSIMLFLLFYYTDALHLPVEVAALTYMVASIWDGIVNFVAGVLVDRRRGGGGFRGVLMVGAIPLGLSFVLAYLPPPGAGGWAVATVFAAHLMFRTAYAAVNVPYLALSARISVDSGDRALVAGLRMWFGTAALVAVTLGTARIGGWLSGGQGATVFLAAAIAFACVATALLLMVGAGVREIPVTVQDAPASLAACLSSLARNRAFVTLNAATMAMIVAATVLTKSVLYYYKYYLGDEPASQVALAAMGVAGAVAVPLWIQGCRWIGARSAWFASAALGIALLLAFGLGNVRSAGVMQTFLMAMQVAMTGLNIVFWAMLPNTIEYGQRMTGLRVEGTVFGLAALLQRTAIGVATGLLGGLMDAVGFVADGDQSAATLAGIRWIVALVPMAFLALSMWLMTRNPLTRDAHAAIVEELEAERRRHPK